MPLYHNAITTITVRYPWTKDEEVMEQVRQFTAELEKLGVTCKGGDIKTTADAEGPSDPD